MLLLLDHEASNSCVAVCFESYRIFPTIIIIGIDITIHIYILLLTKLEYEIKDQKEGVQAH